MTDNVLRDGTDLRGSDGDSSGAVEDKVRRAAAVG